MFQFIKSKTYVAAVCIILVTVLFILHEMLSSSSQSPINENNASKLDSQSIAQMGKSSAFMRQLISATYKISKPYAGEKLVHLDLKGAAPLISYLDKLFPYLKSVGATGLLIEYEDMFPYYGKLANIPAYNAYSHDDISHIVHSAAASGLKVVPLIQTFGHLEFILKLHEYKHLREVPLYPQVICPTHNKTPSLIFTMIDQVIQLHPGIAHLHIGSDEVYHIGRCDRCSRTMEERGWSKEQLFLSHLRNVTSYIRRKYPHIRPIIWDDELRTLSEDLIEEFEVAKYTDIMVWKYTQAVSEYITDAILDKYARLFKNIWIASAFKGASGPDSMITDVRLHVENHVSWMEVVDRWHNLINFKGIALTGWQRYDHFAILCELLPVAIPSVTMCLQYLEGKEVDVNTMSSVLSCDFPIAWGTADIMNALQPNAKCLYPGSNIYYLVNSLYVSLQDVKFMDKDVARGWFSWYNVIHNFSNPSHAEEASSMSEYYKMQLLFIQEKLKSELLTVFDMHTTDEWLETNVTPTIMRLTSIAEARERLLLSEKVWPRRPLDRITAHKKELDKICVGSKSLSCSLLGLKR